MSYSETITRTDLTNILNEVFPLPANTRLQYVGDYGSTIFNGTWTATDNGIMIQMLGSNTSGSNAYWYINDTTENKPVGCISFTANGTTNSASFPIVKGHTYASSAVSAVNSATAYFFKFVTGIFSQADEVDYIVEQGTSGIWTYRKWNSGISECWGMTSPTSIAVASWNAWGSIYEGLITTEIDYPTSLFTSYPSLSATAVARSTAGTMGIEISATGSASQTPYFYALRPNKPSAAITVSASIHAYGTWK